MKNEIGLHGVWNVDARPQLQDNFFDLYRNQGRGLQHVLSKLNSTNQNSKDDTIRISIWADSVWNVLGAEVQAVISTNFPNKNIEFYNPAQIGGTGTNYHSSMLWDMINWNPDLIIMGEFETNQEEKQETFIRLIKEKTSADILMTGWTVYKTAMEFIAAKNMTSWKSSVSYKHIQWQYQIAARYNCGLIDWWAQAIPDLYNGVVTPDQLSGVDGIHLLAYHRTEYALPLYEKIFKDINYIDAETGVFYYNSQQLNWDSELKISTKQFTDAIELPDITDISISGTWSLNQNILDKTYEALKSNTVNDYCIIPFNGFGFELSIIARVAGQIKLELSDGLGYVNPSTLIQDYATSAHSGLVGPHKVIVDSNILSNDEISRQFQIEMLSATTYKVTDVTNTTEVLALGDITTDEGFAVTGGQLTIPSNYYGITNWRDTLSTGQIYTFYVKKNWYDTIDIVADNKTQVFRIFGFNRDTYNLKITLNSGQIELDQLLILK